MRPFAFDLKEPEAQTLTETLGDAADALGLDGASGALEALSDG